jgi:hypothetical protein
MERFQAGEEFRKWLEWRRSKDGKGNPGSNYAGLRCVEKSANSKMHRVETSQIST